MGSAESTNHVTEDACVISDSLIQCCDLDIIEPLIKSKHTYIVCVSD